MTSVKNKTAPIEPLKKNKRTALGNLSNAATDLNKDSQENLNQVKEVKKSRYIGLPVPIKKSDSTASKNTTTTAAANLSKGNSKENLSLIPKSKQLVSKSEPKSSISGFQLKPAMKKEKMSVEKPLDTTSTAKISTSLSSLAVNVVDKPESIENIDTDIDEFNANDYAESIFEYYRSRDKKFKIGDYIKDQPHINKQMRLLLVDWMVEVQQQLEFNHEILYLSVKLLDLYLNSKRIEKEKLQLLGGAAMLVACKFEERMAPPLDDFIYVSDNAYDRNELVKMEIDILRTLQYDIGAPLSYTFLRRYGKCVKADMKFLTLARFILELSLQEYKFASVKDSLKACAALYLALKMVVRYEMINKTTGNILITSTENLTATEWNATLCHYTGAYLSDFIEYVPALNNLVMTASSSRYKTILKKYCHPVFYEVAKIPSLPESEIEILTKMCLTDKNPSFKRYKTDFE